MLHFLLCDLLTLDLVNKVLFVSLCIVNFTFMGFYHIRLFGGWGIFDAIFTLNFMLFLVMSDFWAFHLNQSLCGRRAFFHPFIWTFLFFQWCQFICRFSILDVFWWLKVHITILKIILDRLSHITFVIKHLAFIDCHVVRFFAMHLIRWLSLFLQCLSHFILRLSSS